MVCGVLVVMGKFWGDVEIPRGERGGGRRQLGRGDPLEGTETYIAVTRLLGMGNTTMPWLMSLSRSFARNQRSARAGLLRKAICVGGTCEDGILGKMRI